jgi:uncharacterized protein (DUF488 family)
MESAICTIGFAGKTAEEFFALLKQAGVQKLIDVRENRIGQLSGFAKFPDLAFFLDRVAGIAYAYEPRLAPSPEIRDAYRATKDWQAYEKSFLQLMRDRDIPNGLDLSGFGGRVALLCSEPGAERCHRRLVAELLVKSLAICGHTVPIVHLTGQIKAGRKKPREQRRDNASHHRTAG